MASANGLSKGRKDRRKKAFLFYRFSTMKDMKGGRGFVWGLIFRRAAFAFRIFDSLWINQMEVSVSYGLSPG